MVTIDAFRKLVLSFPGTVEQPHFEKTSFRVNKRIFATLSTETHVVVVKLSPIDQSVFCLIDKAVIYPVNNKWGLQGWTSIDLKKVTKDVLKEALALAYGEVLKPKNPITNVKRKFT